MVLGGFLLFLFLDGYVYVREAVYYWRLEIDGSEDDNLRGTIHLVR